MQFRIESHHDLTLLRLRATVDVFPGDGPNFLDRDLPADAPRLEAEAGRATAIGIAEVEGAGAVRLLRAVHGGLELAHEGRLGRVRAAGHPIHDGRQRAAAHGRALPGTNEPQAQNRPVLRILAQQGGDELLQVLFSYTHETWQAAEAARVADQRAWAEVVIT